MGKLFFMMAHTLSAKLQEVDEASVYIVPIGLDTSEGVLVGNIDSLENGKWNDSCDQ